MPAQSLETGMPSCLPLLVALLLLLFCQGGRAQQLPHVLVDTPKDYQAAPAIRTTKRLRRWRRHLLTQTDLLSLLVVENNPALDKG